MNMSLEQLRSVFFGFLGLLMLAAVIWGGSLLALRLYKKKLWRQRRALRLQRQSERERGNKQYDSY